MRFKPLNRRQVLRGLLAGSAVHFSLPLLECMLNTHGTALADTGMAIPKRFGMWFWGVGAMPNYWQLSSTGTGWTPSEGLAALAPVRDYVSVIANTSHTVVPVVHYGGQAYLLTGRYNPTGSDQQTSQYGSPGGPSVDQIVAQAWKGKTPINSIVVGVSEAFQGSCCGFPPTQASWLDNNVPNHHEFSLVGLYKQLFGANSAGQASASARAHYVLRQQTILDAVGKDLAALQTKVGKADKIRLEAHAQAVRDIETSINSTVGSQCKTPSAPAELDISPNHELLSERNRAFCDMIAVALACDLTRVFTVQFTGRENDCIFWQVGATQGTHTLSHNADPASINVMNKAFAFTMGEFAYLLQKLRDTPEGSGNLLDHSCIYATSCIGNPVSHSYDRDLLLMLAGGASGALKPGISYRASSEKSTSVALTALRAVDVQTNSFGSDGLESTNHISGLTNF